MQDPSKVSKIVESEYGFHIIQLIEKRGDRIKTRHILLKPHIPEEALAAGCARLDSIADDIRNNKFSFEEAASVLSQDKDTRNNHGLLPNPNTNTSRFEMQELPPEIAKVVDKMKVGEISEAFTMIPQKTGKEECVIVKLKSRTTGHKATIADDYQNLQEIVLEKRRDEVLDKWIREKQKHTYVRIKDIGRITVRSSIRAGSKNNPEGFTWICMQKKNTKNHFLNKHRYLLVGILCLFGICLLSAQDKKKSTGAPEKRKVDSIEQKKTETSEKKKTRVDLLYADEAQADKQLRPDVQVLIGSVRMKHDSMYMFCDSALIFEKINSVEAFGNVRMEQGDTLFIYGDYLYYDGMSQLAMLRENVRMINRNTVLTTDSLNYDRLYDLGITSKAVR